MVQTSSKLAASRSEGRHQIDEQRASILAAAERLFLHTGLENTKMVDIAAEAGITKITLYRYFKNRDDLAVEIQTRMLNKISSLVTPDVWSTLPETAKSLVHSMILNFPALRDAYRYMNMFDHVYPHHPSASSLIEWTKLQIQPSFPVGNGSDDFINSMDQLERISMVLCTVVWFLEKSAYLGYAADQNDWSSSETKLLNFEEMIVGYFDKVG